MELVWIAKSYRCKTYIGFQRLSIKKKILSNNFNIHYVLKFNLLKPACFKCHQNFTCFSMFFNVATRKQIYNLVCILFLLGSAALSPTWLLSFQFISESDWLHFHILTPERLILLSDTLVQATIAHLRQMQETSNWFWKSVSHHVSFMLKGPYWLLIAVRIKAKHAAMAIRFHVICPCPPLPLCLVIESSHQGSNHIGLLWTPQKTQAGATSQMALHCFPFSENLFSLIVTIVTWMASYHLDHGLNNVSSERLSITSQTKAGQLSYLLGIFPCCTYQFLKLLYSCVYLFTIFPLH